MNEPTSTSPDLGGGGRGAAGGAHANPSDRGATPSTAFGGPPPPRAGEVRGVTRFGWAAYALALVVIALDQASKAWVLGPLDLVARGQVDVLPPWLNFTYVSNSGVSFHLFAGGALSRWGLTIFSVLVAGALAFWARSAAKAVSALGIGLIIGGALGNAIDRVRLGHVTDFVDVTGLHFPWVFNVADSAITVGVVVLLLEGVLFAPKKPDAAATTGPADPAPPAR